MAAEKARERATFVSPLLSFSALIHASAWPWVRASSTEYQPSKEAAA